MRRFRHLPLLLILLGAQTARAQPKPLSEIPAAPTGERVAEPVAPAPKQPDPAAPQPPTPAPAPKSVEPPAASVAPPASGPGPGLVPPLNPAHTDAQYPTTARVAITEFLVTGEETSRALAMRLQEGFAVGLTRTALIYVLDSVDVARYIDIFPELQKCEGSICIKRLGQMLDVSHILRVTVAVTGNSYDMTARLFGTEGLSPADVPIDTQTRFCPVCTVDEARQKITQLGEAIKNPVELWLAQQRPPPPPPPPPSSWRRPIAALGVALGFATIVGGGALLANVGHDNKAWPAVAGAMIGIGASAAAFSCYLLIAAPTDPAKATLKVAVGGRF